MFEKEAKKWVKENTKIDYRASYGEFPIEPSATKSFKAGAEFGYNKANEWHNIRENPNDLPTDTSALYYVLVYSWTFGFSHLYKRYGIYIPAVCEWNGEYFKALDRDAYTNARNIKNCIAWKEIVLSELKEIKENE